MDFSGTLKSRMWRYFTANGTYRYIDILENLVENYRQTKHSRTGIAPAKVNRDNFKQAWRKLYGQEWPGYQRKDCGRNEMASKYRRYQIGDKVRVSRVKGPLDKGYLPNWTEETFTVVQRIDWDPPVYKLKRDSDGALINGTYYSEEMLPVVADK